MKVWRVEDAHGVGLHTKLVAPYNEEYDLIVPTAFNQAAYSDWHPFDNDLAAHPPPEDDTQLTAELARSGLGMADHFFGFKSARQMREYLYRDSWLMKLDEFDMFVSLYWVEEGLLVGDNQVLMPKGLVPCESHRIGYYFGLAADRP